MCSALVLALTGTGWALYRDVTAGIVTTDVIAGGGDGGALNILLVGVDSRTDAHGNPLPEEIQRALHSGPDTGVLNSDTIILLHLPEGGGAASAFSIPRDSYVQVPDHGRRKINAAYPLVKAQTAQRLVDDGVRDRRQIEAQAGQAGRSALIESVQELTGQTVDHYAEINLVGFYNLTRAIGGVDVCLRRPVDEPLSGARLPAGRQTIAGADALAFVRQRHDLPDGDLSRVRRQQVFLAAVAKKVLAAGTLTDPARLAALVDVAQQSVVIDAGWDLLAFAQQAADIAAGDLSFATVPTEGTARRDGESVVLVDPAAVGEFVERTVTERAAAAEAAQAVAATAPDPPPPSVDVIAERYVVDVRNGTRRVGAAADTRAHLRSLGFSPGTTATTDATEHSTVRYTGADGAAAEAVAAQLGWIGTDQVGSDEVAPGHLMVVIGDDFHAAVLPAPTTPAAAPDPTAAPLAVDAPITADGVPCID